jgi:hypothetical protein
MFKCDIKIEGIEEAKKMLSKERIRKVILNAINDTARIDVKKDVVEEMKKVFDRPTPYTLGSVYTKLNAGDMSVEIGLKDWGGKGTPASEYLKPQVFGGGRPMKRSEKHLGSYYVPGAGARLNQYGNLSGAQITQILSALKAFPETGYMANITPGSRKRNKKLRNFFMVKNPGGNLHPGVYEKMANGSIKCILIFTRSPSYQVRLRWFETIKKSFNENIQKRFDQAFERALTVKF